MALAGKLPEYDRSRLELVKQFNVANAAKSTWEVSDAQARHEQITNDLNTAFTL